MREDTVVTKVYLFDELSDTAKQKALEKLCFINVDFDWWESICEDAATIGLVIEEFDLDHNARVRGQWTEDAEDTACLILEHHGETCETYKDAVELQNSISVAGSIFEDTDDFDPEYEEFTESDEYEKLCKEFQRTICEDYRIILQKEYEYQTSTKAILETIEANEYEFTVGGRLY